MFMKAMTRVLWSLLFAAILVGYASTVLQLAGHSV